MRIEREDQEGRKSFDIQRDHTLSHIRENGGLKFYPDLRNFVKTAIFSTRVVFISVEKSSKYSRQFFWRKLLAAIIPGKVQGVVGGGETPFSSHDFFHFLFNFHDIIEHCNDRRATISVSFNCSLLSPAWKQRHTITIIHIFSAPHHPSPRLRSRRVWRSSLLTRIDSVSVFSVLGYLDHWLKLWTELSAKSQREFSSNFQAL